MKHLYILGVNDAEESININIDYTMTWKDEYLQWNPSDFADPVYSLLVLEDLIWQPDIVMNQMLSSTPLLEQDKQRAKINFDGQVIIYSPQVVTFSCPMTVGYFPFDTQTCLMVYGPWVYDATQVIFEQSNASSSDIAYGNSEWNVTSFTFTEYDYADSFGNYSAIKYVNVKKRNPVYYICVLIIPTFIITSLCLLGIFSPSTSTGERVEKVNLGLTTLLTVAVILSIVAGEMPKATTLPLLGYFVLAELCFCALAILASLLIMFIHERAIVNHFRPPKWIQNLLRSKKHDEVNYLTEQETCTSARNGIWWTKQNTNFTAFDNGNSEWQMISFKPHQRYYNSSDGGYIELLFELVLKRNSVYYICVLIIPTFIITALSLFGIFTPFNNFGDREEKVSLGLTTLLTIAVILNIVPTEMPKANELPLLGMLYLACYFVLAELVICMLGILISIMTLVLHERALLKQCDPPGWLTTCLMCKRSNYDRQQIRFPLVISGDLKVDMAFSDLCMSLKSVGDFLEEHKTDQNRISRWCEIFDRVDTFCLIVLQSVNIAVSCWLML